MINPKSVQRKKSQNLITFKDHQKDQQPQMKRKKSVSNIVCSSKLKKQSIGDKQQKLVKKQPKQQKQKKMIHSLSKGKINKKHHKSQRNDQNFNSMNHKRSIEKFNTVGKNSKQLVKTKKPSDQISHEVKHEKIKNTQFQSHLTKIPSEVKISGIKKVEKKRLETKQIIDERHFFRHQEKQKVHEEKLKHSSNQVTKTLSRNPTSKKLITGQKSKLKKSSSQTQSQPRKSTRQKMKPSSKIAQIIQRSILYSDVNYDFKEQISLLGSGIKRQQDFFVPFPFQFQRTKSNVYCQQFSERSMIQHKAAITIQRHFRGYIQRKYIEEARYIIDCVKKIQRFWRGCLLKKNQVAMKKIVSKTETQMKKSSVQSSLITVKDLNEDTYRMKDICVENRNGSNNQIDRNMLKDLIKNLLSEETVNESIKQKIRSVIADESQKFSEFQIRPRAKTEDNSIKTLTKQNQPQTRSTKPNPPTLQLDTEKIQQQHHTKQDYVKRKISMQISSQRNFNSPMSNLSKQFLTSPNLKRLTSPKCLSSSFSKQVKSSYNNYFKSTKNGMFMSPKSSKQEGQRVLRSHSGSKWSKEKQQCTQGHCIQQIAVKQSKAFQCEETNKVFQTYTSKQPVANIFNKPASLQLTKNDYLLKADINLNSPIIQCKQASQSFTQQVNLLSTQKLQSQQETQRFSKNSNNQLMSPSVLKHLKPFPTQFCFIQQFCLLITDYLREDEQTTQVFLQKVKGLKYCKIQKVFQSWQHIQYEQYWCENQPLRMMILEQHNNRPAIFSRTQKNLLLQYPSLRLFLSQNDYSTQQISLEYHPKSAYVKFMFDVFEQCIYENYRNVGLKQLTMIQNKQSKRGIDYMSVILSQAMGNMLRSAQMLCGSFQTDDMTQVEKQQRQLMNQMRLGEMIKDYREEKLDEESCGMWIQLLLGKIVFEQLIEDVVDDVIGLMQAR